MYVICTDGSCLGNPGPGGYCAIIKDNFSEKVVSGGIPDTTNQRAELKAVIAGLENIPVRQHVILLSDSQYVINTMNQGWKKRKNNDLWDRLDELVKNQELVEWHWIKGHDSHPDNERANTIAQNESTIAKAKEILHETIRIRRRDTETKEEVKQSKG